MLSEAYDLNIYDDVSNPIDGLIDIMVHNDWTYERKSEDELTVQVTSNMGTFNLIFLWQEEYSAMQFVCAPDICIHADHFDEAKILMNDINADLWLGHFDMREKSTKDEDQAIKAVPCFRHTTLFRGMNETSGVEPMEDLIDVAIAECERYYMTFSLLSVKAVQDSRQLTFSMMDVVGSS